MATQADSGKKALEKQNYDEAIKQYTNALEQSPTSPDYLIQRSTAYTRSQKHGEALADAEKAVVYAQKRAKKELIVESQARRGLCLYLLERYGDAKFVLEIVKRLNPEHKSSGMWLGKAQMALQKLAEDDERRKVSVSETPDVASSVERTAPAASGGPSNSTSASAAAPAAPQQTPAEKIRHDWYQNGEKVFFTLMAKGVPQDKTTVDITERALNISFPLVSGSSYDLTLDPLFAPVRPDECITRVLPTKLEVILVKGTPGQKWKALESDEPATESKSADANGDSKTDDGSTKRAVFTSEQAASSKGPAYPTSSKHGPKDWDAITTSKEDEDEIEGGDEANAFFKKLFKNATPETQRAMMKSYTESNGTALSTNWDEVSKGKVETTPPDGMEARKW
ncbi:SGS-domain-containing protein [Hortaea werneckii]|uniref:SGS-domain-containing protein n=1 Tax=Hortaea werneckii TaxID=91943 RepID=A0A3M7DWF9_HORWE|nr:SGS-domain-containing protein [Hortaea werneckii]KAI7560093.1 SGS-domain-containing protein [Hortaea werneckii]KAI7613994.1 SGS-domain-containing protein [Hortaea werneckii]KAI7623959.1 SGS-domain-containing protein [Hortaea werneckii]KAI7698581.1 SGS-domain-containing protein [Hortaea werneckii]